MEWRDEGLIIGLKRHGETSVIAEIFTRGHGRHLGIVRGGRSQRMQPLLQPGNSVEIVWRARLEEHLGTLAVEPLRLRAAAIMDSGLALQGINLLGACLRLVPERDPHAALHETAELIADNISDRDIAPALMVRLELAVLQELGFGLDFSECAATGRKSELVYVSPKSGRAVSREAGAPYHERMLALPGFLNGVADTKVTPADVNAGFALTGYFLERDVYSARGIPAPEARRAYLAELAKKT
jgi:DNA repair protein RecO (recombination protein O)